MRACCLVKAAEASRDLGNLARTGELWPTRLAPFKLWLMIHERAAGRVPALLIFLLTFASHAAGASKPNIVLITLESARADRMGFLGSKAALTPNLDHLAAQSVVFDHAYAQAPGTLVSHASILSGSYQTTGTSEIGGVLAATLPYLPDLLKAEGYQTAAFVSSIDLDPVNGVAQGFERGFQKYDAGFRSDARIPYMHRRGLDSVAAARAWLAANSQHAPFFLWIQIGDADIATERSYNAGVSATDSAVGKLLEGLRKQTFVENTVIAVVADHGQSLGAHDEDAHGIFLYNETIHVPLLIKLPEAQAAPQRVSAKVRLVDIAPTLLEIAGIAVPSQMQGQSLLRIAKAGGGGDQAVYSRSDFPQRAFGWSALESWRAGKYLYIRAPQPELYDTEADPGEEHNLAQSSKGTLDTMAAQLDNFDRRLSGEAGKGSSTPSSPLSTSLSKSEMQKLASLGYVGLQNSSSAATAVAGIDPKDKIATANKVVRVSSEGVAPSQPDSAITSLTPLVSADSSMYLAEYILGIALAEKARYSDAIKHLHRAIELQPTSSWAHYEIGATLLKTGDYKTAAVHLEIAAGHLSAFSPVHTALAQAYSHLGREDDAKRELNKVGRK
jgi:choline-sulfatase